VALLGIFPARLNDNIGWPKTSATASTLGGAIGRGVTGHHEIRRLGSKPASLFLPIATALQALNPANNGGVSHLIYASTAPQLSACH